MKHDRKGRPIVCRDANHERPTVVCSEQASHPSFSRDSQNLFLEEDVNHDRTGRPVVCPQIGAREAFRSQEIETLSFREEAVKHDRTETPDVCRDASHEQGHEQSMLNEVDIDFRIPGLPLSVVKQAGNYRVREFVKRIENHPHRQSLQRDLQQNNAYNPFSEKSKKMIKDMDNVELFEFFETDPKTECKECLLYWSRGIACCTCGHLLKESEVNRSAIQCTLDLLSIQNYVIKKGRPHGKLQNKEINLLPIIWERDASRCIPKRSTIVLWTILNFVHLNSSMIDMKRSVSRWMSLRKKISHIIWRKQNTFDTERIGGFLSISLEDLDLEKSFWTSTMRWPLQTIYTKNLENDTSGQCPFWMYQYWHQSSSSSSSRWQWSDSWWSS